MENELSAVTNLYLSFFSEMNSWEKYCETIDEDTSLSEDAKTTLMRNKVSDIFAQYCTPKDRKNGRPNCISFGFKGSYIYDTDKENISSIEQPKSIRIIIYTERINGLLHEKHCYLIIKKDNQWRIDGKKRLWNDKWSNIYL